MLVILVDRVVMKQGVERGILRGVPRPIAPRSTGDEIELTNNHLKLIQLSWFHQDSLGSCGAT